LEDLVPERTESHIDIFNQLFQGLILREKDFRAWVKEHDWSLYADHNVALFCSSDAVIPTWAYMLVSSALQPYTKNVFFTNPENLSTLVAERVLASINEEDYTDKRVVIKGCGKRAISNHAYVLLTNKLVRTAKTVMFGEPCSTVPVYKQRK
jgi:dihydroneopterin aldolase